MMNVIFGIANKDDISELIRLLIMYIIEDYGSFSEDERHAIEEQLPDYFERKLGTEMIIKTGKK